MAPTQHSQLWGGRPALPIAVFGSDHVEVPHLSGTGIFVVTLLGLGLCLEGRLVERLPRLAVVLSLPQNQPAGEKNISQHSLGGEAGGGAGVRRLA